MTVPGAISAIVAGIAPSALAPEPAPRPASRAVKNPPTGIARAMSTAPLRTRVIEEGGRDGVGWKGGTASRHLTAIATGDGLIPP